MARLLFTLPTVKTYELGLHGAQAVDRFGGLGSMTTLVVRELCLSLDNFWFSAHLLDLLHHAGALGQTEGEQHGPVLKIRFGPPTADFWSIWSKLFGPPKMFGPSSLVLPKCLWYSYRR